MGNKIVIMNRGHVEEYDTPQGLIINNNNQFVKEFLGGEYAIKLLSKFDLRAVMKNEISILGDHDLSVTANLQETLSYMIENSINQVRIPEGMGMSKKEEFCQVIFPIALPVIIAGLRTALIINVSAATLAAQIGGGGLGILLLNAMKTGKAMTIIEGTIPICLLAVITDKILKNIETYFSIKQ